MVTQASWRVVTVRSQTPVATPQGCHTFLVCFPRTNRPGTFVKGHRHAFAEDQPLSEGLTSTRPCAASTRPEELFLVPGRRRRAARPRRPPPLRQTHALLPDKVRQGTQRQSLASGFLTLLVSRRAYDGRTSRRRTLPLNLNQGKGVIFLVPWCWRDSIWHGRASFRPRPVSERLP